MDDPSNLNHKASQEKIENEKDHNLDSLHLVC